MALSDKTMRFLEDGLTDKVAAQEIADQIAAGLTGGGIPPVVPAPTVGHVAVFAAGSTLADGGTFPTIPTSAALANAPLLTMASYTPQGSITGQLNLVTPAFSGTGFATLGQVITTTENKTMTANQCAGMWFVDTGTVTAAPVLILSNTAVTGAPAVLTVQGAAPASDEGTWEIVTLGAATFVGTPAILTGSNTAPTITLS